MKSARHNNNDNNTQRNDMQDVEGLIGEEQEGMEEDQEDTQAYFEQAFMVDLDEYGSPDVAMKVVKRKGEKE